MLKSISLEVVGGHKMVCDGCEQRVEQALKGLMGVDRVRARARDQRIEVLFDTATLDPSALVERLAKAGYQTAVVRSPSDG